MNLQNMQSRASARRRNVAPSADRLFYTNSSIADPETNLQQFFSTCVATWEALYTENERIKLIEMLPVEYRIYTRDTDGKLMCPLTSDYVENDHMFKDGIARFQREVSEGYWTNTWRSNARKAAIERAEGKFDEYLEQHAEELFGSRDDCKDAHGEDESDTLHNTASRTARRHRKDKTRKSGRTRNSERSQMLLGIAGETED